MAAASANALYVKVANQFVQQVNGGALRPGDRVPSLRRLSRQHRISISTALQAYLLLENQGYLEARPQSGFYVRTPYSALIPEPKFEPVPSPPKAEISTASITDIIETGRNRAYIPFGAGCASPELFPYRRLNIILRRIVRREPLHSTSYDWPPGWEPLRRQIARRAGDIGWTVSPADITITSGALEAVNLSLRAVAKAGDVIAVESPTYFGILECISALGMKVLEVPTHPQQGMDLDELQRAIRKHRVKACVVMSNCHNPLGYVISDERKKALVELTASHGVAVIEDDLYGDLAFQAARPRPLKYFDAEGLVLQCSSFSKVLSPGMRVGWVASERFGPEIQRLKVLTSVVTDSLSQRVAAEFVRSGSYDRHTKRLRQTLATQIESVRQAIAKYFPEGTRISRPAGGYMLWIELPTKIDALELYRAALAHNISILPGKAFTATNRFKNHIRLNCGHAWTETHDRALLTLGRLCEKQM